jgi:hypothetical protein
VVLVAALGLGDHVPVISVRLEDRLDVDGGRRRISGCDLLRHFVADRERHERDGNRRD